MNLFYGWTDLISHLKIRWTYLISEPKLFYMSCSTQDSSRHSPCFWSHSFVLPSLASRIYYVAISPSDWSRNSKRKEKGGERRKKMESVDSCDEEAPLVADSLQVLTPKNYTRDVHILSCAFLLIFLAYGAAQNLETTVNTVK